MTEIHANNSVAAAKSKEIPAKIRKIGKQAKPVSRPDFLPLTLWFAYLLRTDVRGGRSIADPEAMRDFCCWWLLAGKVEYPAVWGVTPEILAVAMESVELPVGAIPRLLRYLWTLRADIRARFPLRTRVELVDYLCWYRLAGSSFFGYAPLLPTDFVAMTEADHPKLPEIPWLAVVMWQWSGAGSINNLSSAAFRASVAAAYANYKAKLVDTSLVPPPPAAPVAVDEAPSGEPGINLIGFPRAEFGLGEDVRMLARVLDEAKIPYTVIDVADALALSARQEDESLADRIGSEMRYPLSILCMSPFDAATLWLKKGTTIFDGRYIIGYWPWELERWPDPWHEIALLVGEIWAPSQYSATAFAAQPYRHVRYLPPCVELPKVRKISRRDLGLPTNKFLFLYPFDPNSYLPRKNPEAAVRAFRLAFPGAEDDVRLVLRVNGVTGGTGWERVTQAIGDDERVIVIEGVLPRVRAVALMAACNCLVSLHRAEGFGRNIAEAKLLGLQVITTGYSGCMDFSAPQDTVPYRKVPVGSDYPFGEGLFWAEPDVAQAAQQMRNMLETAGGHAGRRKPLKFAASSGRKLEGHA
jgi:hypothetical protein